MNYYEMLYDTTAMLLLYTVQMKEYPYSTVISRHIYESKYHWDKDIKKKIIDAIGILLSLERNATKIPQNLLDELERIINSISDEFISNYINKDDYAAFSSDLNTAHNVIKYYKTAEGKIE